MTIRFFDTAMFAPALQDGYLSVASGKGGRAVPSWMQKTDLDFLKTSSPFFHHPVALYSAGHVTNYKKMLPPMLSARDKSNTVIIGDSGGFQYATGARTLNSVHELEPIFDWLVHNTDIAVTFDVPPWTADEPGTRWTSYGECLADTLTYLEFIERANKTEKHPFLNVLQGATLNQAERWYEAVKHFDFYGWAFAHETKYDFHIALHLIGMILRDFEDKYRERELWIHFLGVSDLQTFVLMDQLQTSLRRRLGHERVQITSDTSSYFQSAGKYGQYSTPPVFLNAANKWSMAIPSKKFDPLSQYGSCDPYPVQSSVISGKLEMGDLIVNRNDGRGNRFDSTAGVMIANHNLHTEIKGFASAAKRMGTPRFKIKTMVAPNLVDACECIDYLLTLPAALSEDDRHKPLYGLPVGPHWREPTSIFLEELSDRKVMRTLKQATSRDIKWSWKRIFGFGK